MSHSEQSEPKLVVGIGASAGGLEPLEQFFASTPLETGMAYVVVQHLSPDYPSLMSELLARHTQLPIHRVEDGMRVDADAVYLIPPRMNMVIQGGVLRLTEQERDEEHPPLPIDFFFHSLAEDTRGKAAAIVLSGTGTDGSRGVKHVKVNGGLVLVQDKLTTKFSGMPRASIESGSVDAELSPDEMPAYLMAYLKDPSVLPPTPDSMGDEFEGDLDHVDAVLRLLNKHHEIDFALYKPTTVHRRIERRILLSPEEDIDAYLKRLREDPDELNRLYKDMLIGVTQFFRDAAAYESLSQHVIPKLFQKRDKDAEIRVWVAGCATGEEAYSIAMLLDEAREKIGRPEQPIRVFATDAHRTSIDHAADGRFEAERLREVMPDRLNRYFVPSGKDFMVMPELRKMITFAPHNLMCDAPFTRMDLVTCRNVLIYFRQPAQAQVLSLLHFALKVDGTLFLGPSETAHPYGDEFEPIDLHWRIFRKRREVRLMPQSSLPTRTPAPSARLNTSTIPTVSPPILTPDARLLRAYDSILEDVVHNAVLVNDRREVVHIFGESRELIRLPVGRRSFDLLPMLDEKLRPAVGAAVQKAKDSAETVSVGIVCVRNGLNVLVSAKSLRDPISEYGFTLVRLDRVAPQDMAPRDAAGDRDVAFNPDGANVDTIIGLEKELQYTKENLQATIEELETTNEELNATNEELIASNEELQSTNEELHSVNEELHTVNAEYQQKITELTQLTNDMNNLLASTQIGTLFLDTELRVRRFTPSMEKMLRVREADIGRPIDELRFLFEYPGLVEDARQVMRRGEVMHEEVRTEAGEYCLVQFNPYRVAEGEVLGVVISFVDVTELRETELQLRESRQRFEAFMHNSPMMKWALDDHGRHVFVNPVWEQIMGVDRDRCIGKRVEEVLPQETVDAFMRGAQIDGELACLEHGPMYFEVEIPVDDKTFVLYVTKFLFHDAMGNRMIGGTAQDISDLKAVEQELVESKLALEDRINERTAELIEAKGLLEERVAERTQALSENNHLLAARNLELDQFAHAASHDLRSPLRTIQGFVEHLGDSLDAGDEGEVRDALARIDAAAERMSELIESLLLFAAVGREEFDAKPVDLSKTLEQVRQDLEPEIESADARLEVVGELPVVLGDSAMLRQVLQNLMSNALKYRDERQPEIVIRVNQEAGQHVVSIKDNGIGFPAEDAERVFEPFQRLAKGKARRGTGIGLSICKRVIERHGGKIWAGSRPKEGSTFSFALPTEAEATEQAPS